MTSESIEYHQHVQFAKRINPLTNSFFLSNIFISEHDRMKSLVNSSVNLLNKKTIHICELTKSKSEREFYCSDGMHPMIVFEEIR